MNQNGELENNKMTNPSLESQEFLTFVLGSEIYGIDILKVQEIRGYDSVTSIANTPEFIKGVINLRGHIVPIVDLRIKLHLERISYDEFTVVIILNMSDRIVGIVVDGVSDVLHLGVNEIRPVPDIVSGIDTRYIIGLASIEDRMLILVDIEQLMDSHEMALFESAAVI
ncbi:chemotaxis protein CheW [Polynucleobacter sp. MWH-Mekk-B1]|uniref:chemotaxis protein CheW n=1 Tax=Polynucleobacter finlandensis TaxID=1855894 RepID=UPI001C0AE3E4|nr:chemotaxis protein CheW [Polynucleobacter finlandensis]MBU3545137.1 chemotaxis protein CheW [Polynucleobacter finlandensis]